MVTVCDASCDNDVFVTLMLGLKKLVKWVKFRLLITVDLVIFARF